MVRAVKGAAAPLMRILGHYEAPAGLRGAALAIGNFDGVHLGHQAVIGAAGAAAGAAGAPFGVLTFEPHPRSVFQPGAAPFRLTPFRSKARAIAALGADLLVALRFDLAFAARSAEDFVTRILVEGLGVRHVVVGYDFIFGNRRRGTPELLRRMGAETGFAVTVLDPVEAPGGQIYSSTRIRNLLAAGRPDEAAALLGRPWEIEGRVAVGDRIGRSLGFPTANVPLGSYLRPAVGIYAVRAGIAEKGGVRWHDAAASLGWRPTVGGSDLRLEAHLLDFAGDLYGRQLRIAFIDYLRPEVKFPDLAALRRQIAEDCRAARRALGQQRDRLGEAR
jgi:riboflavin kinase / FMN adenylyltransferase